MRPNQLLTRPLLRWHGGKWRLAVWLLSLFPPHRRYTEAYGGAFSVGLRKPRCYAEIWNDLDDTLVNVFRVMRDREMGDRLVRLLELTPFARAEFELSYKETEDPVERARRTIVRSFMGFGTDATNGIYRTGFRSNSYRSHTTPAHDWTNYAPALQLLCERIRPTDGSPGGVVLENRPALEVLAAHDGVDTLHLVDPPYLHETRSRRANRRGTGVIVYNHELSDDDHLQLLHFLRTLKGMVVLCGYRSAMYDEMLSDWRVVEHAARADGARARVEVAYMNPAARDAAPSPTLWCSSGEAGLEEEPRQEEGAAPP